MTTIECKQIVFEPLVYPRTLNQKGEHNWLVAYRYSRKMLAGEIFPPIIVCKLNSKYILVDGLHRLKAWRDYLKKSKIEVEFIECEDLDQIYVEALRRNNKHGLQLSPYEIAEAIRRLKDKGHKISEIGRILGMTVTDIKTMTESKIKEGKDGEMAVKSVLEGVDVSNVSPEDQSLFVTASQVRAFEEVIKIIENGWLDDKNEQVLKLVSQLKELLKRF